ncbi:DUF1372 family protein [Streptococcus anginosus]|uniref:DUF1372 family protein n=1 Tax=Streptococcus anginosus TaxID=1328 RepID=UPI00321BEDDE
MKRFIAILIIFSVGLNVWQSVRIKELEHRQPIIIHEVDNAGAEMPGRITNKEIIEGRYTVTAGAYGKFLVTKEQYEAIKVGDPIPDYLKGVGR